MFIFFGMIADDQTESGISHVVKAYLVSSKEDVFNINVHNHDDKVANNGFADKSVVFGEMY